MACKESTRMVLRLNKSLQLAESILNLQLHETAQAQCKYSSHSTVNTPLLACYQQCQRRPLSIGPKFHAKWSSPQTAGDLNISNNTILNTFKLHPRGISLLSARLDQLNQLRVSNSTRNRIQCETWMCLPTLNKLKTLQTRSLKPCYPLCHGRTNTPAPPLSWAITVLSDGDMTLRVDLRRTYKTIHTTRWCHLNNTFISRVGSTKKARRPTMTSCWRKKPLLRISQGSSMWMASSSSWLTSPMSRLLVSGNYTLQRILDWMKITDSLSNTAVEASSTASDGWSGS